MGVKHDERQSKRFARMAVGAAYVALQSQQSLNARRLEELLVTSAVKSVRKHRCVLARGAMRPRAAMLAMETHQPGSTLHGNSSTSIRDRRERLVGITVPSAKRRSTGSQAGATTGAKQMADRGLFRASGPERKARRNNAKQHATAIRAVTRLSSRAKAHGA